MKDTLALHLFQSLSAKEVLRFGKFLQSPYFNHRTDVQAVIAGPWQGCQQGVALVFAQQLH